MSSERVFADTNFFLRYLTNDVPEQADAIEQLLKHAADGSLVLITNSLVIAEMVWTLESFYRLPRADVQAKIMAILNTPGLEVVEAETILQAILWYVEKNVDYIDAFNAAWLLNHDLSMILTFNQKHFRRFEQLKVRVPGENG